MKKNIPELNSSYRPFNKDWLNSTLQETLLPGSPWAQLEEMVDDALSQKIMKESEKDKNWDVKCEIVCEMLGPQFLHAHHGNNLVARNSFDMDKINIVERKKLEDQVKSWLIKCREESISEVLQQNPEYSSQHTEFKDFLSNVLKKNLNRFLYKKDQEVLVEKNLLSNSNKHQLLGSLTIDNGNSKMQNRYEKPLKGWSYISDSLGSSLVDILVHSPDRIHEVCQKLSGKQLPGKLRKYLWTSLLITANNTAQNSPVDIRNREKAYRTQFAKSVSNGKTELNTIKATNSPIAGLLKSNVTETYEATPSMQPYKKRTYMLQIANETLNVLYTFDRSFEPHLVFLLFPFQVVYFSEQDLKVEHPYELALYLNLHRTSFFPKWSEIFGIADRALKRVSQIDNQLYRHLKLCAQKKADLDPKDFMIQMIYKEITSNKVDEYSETEEQSKEIFTNPIIFVRKWIGEGFVGILDCPAVLYVWDQLFMNQWESRIIEDMCLVLLLLLKDQFLQASDFKQMQKVFLQQPCHLYTSDIQRAWVHVTGGGSVNEVTKMNRFGQPMLLSEMEPLSQMNPISPMQLSSPNEENKSPIIPKSPIPLSIDSFCLKNLVIMLALPEEEGIIPPEVEKILFSGNNKENYFSVSFSLYYKQTRLYSKQSQKLAQLSKKVTKLSGKNLYEIKFPGELLEFKDIDLSHFTGTFEIPYILVQLRYQQNEIDSVCIGWTKMSMWSEQENTSLPQNVQYGNRTLPLIAGDIPNVLPDDISGSEQQSTISLAVCDSDSIASPTPSPQLEKPWVEYREIHGNSNYYLPPSESFDLYIDSVRFIPDNATVVKVTGRFLNPGNLNTPLEDIEAIPELNSSERSPQFAYRFCVDQTLDHRTVVLLRTYTVDRELGQLLVVGACILPIFQNINSQYFLNGGGHQLRVRSGLPDPNALIDAKSMNTNTVIPCCSLLVRLLPHFEEYEPAPSYQIGYYQSVTCKPTTSEERIMQHYENTPLLSQTVQQGLLDLRADNSQASTDADDEDLKILIAEVLDKKKARASQASIGNLDIHQCIAYDRVTGGVAIKIHGAFGVKGEGRFCSASARLIHTSQDENGDNIVTEKHHFTSFQKSPEWLDQPTILHPNISESTLLLVEIVGIKAVYEAEENRVTGASLDRGAWLGWSVLPLMTGRYVNTGRHLLPLFQGKPSQAFIDTMKERSLQDVFYNQQALKNKLFQLDADYASTLVTIWDGHYGNEEIPTLPVNDFWLSVEKKEKFLKTYNRKTGGKKLSELVLKSLNRTNRKKAESDQGVIKEYEENYERSMNQTLKQLLLNSPPH